jgi:hypothetical protein
MTIILMIFLEFIVDIQQIRIKIKSYLSHKLFQKIEIDIFLKNIMVEFYKFYLKIYKMIDSYKSLIPLLNYTSLKGDFGKLAVIGGSFEYTGAPYYAAMSSLKGR